MNTEREGQLPSTGTSRVPWSTDLVIVAAAVISALVAWLFMARLAGVELTVSAGNTTQEVGGLAVALTATAAALAGVAGLRVLERLTPRALPIWTVAAVLLAVGSVLGPLSATTAVAAATLIGLHAVVAVVVIVAARRSRRGHWPSWRAASSSAPIGQQE